MDLLLAHGYFLSADPHEQRIMKPYPPLGVLYISSYLKSRGFAVEVFDATFQRPEDFSAYLQAARPPVVGIYTNMLTKFSVLGMIQSCKAVGALVVLGGPEPPNYAEEYLARGADIIVIGEGELTFEDLLPHLASYGVSGMSSIAGIVYLDGDGVVVRSAPRQYITSLDALPLPDRSAIGLRAYLDAWQAHHGASSASLICARGCPYHCTWCSHTVYGETIVAARPRTSKRSCLFVRYISS